MIRSIRSLILLFQLVLPTAAWSDSDTFRFHILSDPVTLNPLVSAGGATSHLLNNLYRSFYWYSDTQGLKSELVECRQRSTLLYACKLKDNLKYANGEKIGADDFIRTFQLALSGTASPSAVSHLLSIKNVKDIVAKKKQLKALGIKKLNDREFTIELDRPDQDLLARFNSAVWTPRPAKKKLDDITFAREYATGPYRLKSWERNRSLRLEPNPNYVGSKPQVEVEVLIVSEDTTALKLYQKGQLDFLRRVPAEHYPEIKDEPGFEFRPLLRMDYFGLSGDLTNRPKAREAMTLALDYNEFKKIFHALGRPGCFGMSRSLSGKPICYDFDAKKAKKIWASIKKKPQRIRLHVAAQGGDDLSRAAEWFQAQWKKNLGLSIQIEITDFGVLSDLLRRQPPDVFRRGVPLDRATCLAGLEPFTKGNPDNFLKINRPKVEQNAKLLRTSELSEPKKKALCREALQDLLVSHQIIPTGELHFMTILKNTFSGVELNALNQLNLAGLRKLKPDQSPSEK